MRAALSPEGLPLAPGHSASNKVSWIPEDRVFSNVQRDEILSRFLKGSVLKRMFGSPQMRQGVPEDQKEDPSHTLPGPRMPLRSQRNDCGAMGRRPSEAWGPVLSVASVSQENLPYWNLDSEVPAPENKNLPCGRNGTTCGKIEKNRLEIPVMQLMLELSLSARLPQRAQSSKQGIFQLWSYPFNDERDMENREFKNSSVETGFDVPSNSTQLCTLSRSLTSTPVGTQASSHAGLPTPGLSWSYADGDFFKGRNELRINSCSTTENNKEEAFPAPACNLRYGNGSVEENLTDESDLSENETANDTLPGCFKMDLNLKPETVDSGEESFPEEPSEAFLYPDFLPPPFDTLDLHKLALSKCESWKAAVEPLDSSTEHLITRLLELERLQHTTIQKERPRLHMSSCGSAVSEQPSSSKAVSRVRQAKLPDSLSLQMSYVDKSREKAKTNSGSAKLEQNTSRWNWSDTNKYKWTPRTPLLKGPSTTKQLIATYDIKNLQSPILNACQEASPRPSTTQTSQSLVKTASRRCLPPRSPIPVSSVALSFPESHKEETKTPRTRKKLHQRTILLQRPFYIQKLNCLSPSFIGKGNGSFADQKRLFYTFHCAQIHSKEPS
ncbi:PREDICTED: protein FAM217A isoform X2 [Chinchilla lanigera]|uniref:protein FAM217A isoform X2 n=1 Tax=Chinchilla lanigera TaxID=34839 RepID=UPI00038E97D2|nr:PREDICTED: protein FAM217A isoform X2 [Chinchilla lanigera]XP_013377289.1 PREDICTED: protein FAM217A isoform X2 [Chinchilla lanigera]